jgi:hypothetical protein
MLRCRILRYALLLHMQRVLQRCCMLASVCTTAAVLLQAYPLILYRKLPLLQMYPAVSCKCCSLQRLTPQQRCHAGLLLPLPLKLGGLV